jgi:sulfur-oxidizing protein SoxY
MNRLRRLLLATPGVALGAGLLAALTPLRARGGEWNRAAFEAKNVREALASAGVANPVASQDIVIRAPEIAENGAQVPVEIASRIPGTERVYIFVDKNPTPFAGTFDFMNGAEPFISTRIKMGETSNVRVVVRAGGKYYVALQEVKVTIGGCGA